MKEKILELRLQNKSTLEIASLLECSHALVSWYLNKIYEESEEEIKKQLDLIRHNLKHKTKSKISVTQLSEYQLGIIWGCGSIFNTDKEKTFIMRHNDKYFLEQMQPFIENNIGFRDYQGKKYYTLKTNALDFDELDYLNYNSRNDSERDVPLLDNYKEFLRSYIELHGCFSYCLSYTRGKKVKYYRLRFSIYGNKILIQSLNNIIHDEIGCNLKSPQIVHNNKTAYLVYSALTEIDMIMNYIYGEPYNPVYWEKTDEYMSNPRKY